MQVRILDTGVSFVNNRITVNGERRRGVSTKRITVYYSLNQVGFWMVFCLSSSFAAVYLGALGYSNTKLGSMLALGSVLGFLLGTGLSSFVDTSPRFNAADVLWPVLTLQAAFFLLLLFFPARGVVTTLCYPLLLAFTLAVNTLNLKLCADFEHYESPVNYGIARSMGSAAYMVLSMLLGVWVTRFGVRVIPIAGLAVTALQGVSNALLSRSTVFEFKQVEPRELLPAVERALGILKERSPLPLAWEEGVPMLLATQCGGDVRKAINACELLYEAAETKNGELLLTSEDALQVAQRSAMRYDKGGDAMYDMASALMKSLRGSDPDAALHYLARFLEAGDLVTPCRRLLCSASEDIGMAYPQAVAIVKACVDTAMQLGLPEAQLPLAQAAILLATAPKSNSVVEGINAAWADVRRGRTGDIPRELQNVHADSTGLKREQGYKYPHEFPNHWVEQQYLPDPIKNAVYYRYGDNKVEQAAAKYWEAIKHADGH